MLDKDRGEDSEWEHPVLVVGGVSWVGGPVRIAPGSSSRPQAKGEVSLEVGPADCDPASTLSKQTRFRLNQSVRVDPGKLARKSGKLGPHKHAEMLALREQKIL